ncbi:MAG: PAS domain S-box protein [Actinomycetota bacterium]|nr:PAS domain S-box protein [Actinomycetota bacterium]
MTADPQDGLLVLRYRNVTTERRNAATVASSERRFRALVERAPDVITMIDPDGRITYSSPAIARL